MKLYMILYVAAGIAGTWGPLPYGETECLQRAADNIAELREKAAQHPEVGTVEDWRLACEWRDQRPALTAH